VRFHDTLAVHCQCLGGAGFVIEIT
jgi:hypothetical protein